MFTDRSDAGRILAQKLKKLDPPHPYVLALPRGGVVVGFEVAEVLHAPLSVVVSRKLGAPGNPEFGFGAIAEGGTTYFNEHSVAALGITAQMLAEVKKRELAELDRRVRVYRGGAPLPSLNGKTIILVDDGLATGVTARAALKVLQRKKADALILAVPACASQAASEIRRTDVPVVCIEETKNLSSIGAFYDEFGQVTDAEILTLLAKARKNWDHQR